MDQVKLLIWKNGIQMKRNVKSTLFEIAIPIMLVYLISFLYDSNMASHAVIPNNYNEDSYAVVPSVHFLPYILKNNNLLIGLVAKDSDVHHQYASALDRAYPGHEGLHIPRFSNIIKLFTSEQELEKYCLLESRKLVFAGIVVNEDIITLRMNQSVLNDAASKMDQDEEQDPFQAMVTEALKGPHDSVLFQRVAEVKSGRALRAPGLIPLQILMQEVHRKLILLNQKGLKQDNAGEEKTSHFMCHKMKTLLMSADLDWRSIGVENMDECTQMVDKDKESYEKFLFSNDVVEREVTLNIFPIAEHTERSDPMEGSVIGYMVYLWILPMVRFIRNIVVEKETKIREGMLMMGLQLSTLYISWFVTYGVMCFGISIFAAFQFHNGLFPNSSTFIVFIYLFAFAMSLLAYGFMVSTFFSRSKTATSMSPILLLLLTAPYIPYKLEDSGTNTSSGIFYILKLFVPFSSSANFCLGLKSIFEVDHMLDGGESFDQRVNTAAHNGLSVSAAFIRIIFDAALYIFLGWYFDRILPQEYGIRYPWYFVFQKSYWFPTSEQLNGVGHEKASLLRDEFSNSDNDDSFFESLSPELLRKTNANKCIQIQNLRKQYDNGKVAVKDVSLSMCEGEIFGLLGSNGAGKTTTISMLSGLLPPTSGTATIYGDTIGSDMESIRKYLGVCPQHDVLFEKFTVSEHLVLYGLLKGMDSSTIQSKADEVLEMVGMIEKKKYYAMDLSGGQKRKLSLAIAFIGDSKVIFLDEPTSGMDPYSRRFTWDLLQKNRDGKIMILTTHSMDEADILSNRIAIMANGEVKCCGSSLYLKSKFGVGYQLTVVLKGAIASSKLTKSIQEIIAKHIPEMSVVSDVAKELCVRLPTNTSKRFPGLFDELDNDKQELGIQSYGISVTTVEEVFLKVAENRYMDSNVEVENSGNTAVEIDDQDTLHAKATHSVQFFALFTKRFRCGMRDRRSLFSQLLIPLLILAFILRAIAMVGTPGSDTEFSIASSWGGKHSVVPILVTENTTNVNMDKVLHNFGAVEPSLSPFQVPYKNISKDENYVLDGMAHYLVDHASEVPAYISLVIDQDSISNRMRYQLFHNDSVSNAAEISVKVLQDVLCANDTGKAAHECSFKLHSHPLPETMVVTETINNVVGFMAGLSIMFTLSTITSTFASYIVKEREVHSKQLQMLSGVSIPMYWLANLSWDLCIFSVSCVAILFMIVIFHIDVMNESKVLLAITVCLISYGYAVIPFMYLFSFLFNSHSSAQSYLSYLNLSQVLLMTVSYTMSNIPILCTKNESFQWLFRFFPGYNLGTSLLEVSTLQFAYWRHHCASGLNSSNDITELMSSFGMGGGNGTKYDVFDYEITGQYILWLAITGTLFGCMVISIDVIHSYPVIGKRLMDFTMRWSFHKLTRLHHNSIPKVNLNEDVDVAQERSRVETIPLSSDATPNVDDDVIKLCNLRKVYRGGKTAVTNLSFGLPKGTCFGFLGVNGAGKSTTLKMLTGNVYPTRGEAYLYDTNVVNDQLKARKFIGYCPQEDALLPLLTTREHLELFAKLKGVSPTKVPRSVQRTLEEMDLLSFSSTRAGHLSGGNKRKLSVGIAIIGNPPIIFLDEPSTGVDPVSRRCMWNVISRISTLQKDSSIVLTTHSMEEAQAVCSIASIMVDGQLTCFGSVQHLKDRYGKGLLVDIKLCPPDAHRLQPLLEILSEHHFEIIFQKDISNICNLCNNMSRVSEIQQNEHLQSKLSIGISSIEFLEYWYTQNDIESLFTFLSNTFPLANLIEHHGSYLRYEIPQDQVISLSSLFSKMESQKSKLHIQEYSISQPTLEQIFNQFASSQRFSKD